MGDHRERIRYGDHVAFCKGQGRAFDSRIGVCIRNDTRARELLIQVDGGAESSTPYVTQVPYEHVR